MNEPFQLVTNCSFKGKDYLVQMCIFNSKKLELTITDKLMGENWQCEYDASYIEALTHKTGNFKQFDVFVMMLKSGLLKTSNCITLELLTLEDLEELRCKKIVSSHSSSRTYPSTHLNKRYLILTYSVEFDRIHYPLPLDYCGPPDPSILQNNIRKLEAENEQLKQKNNHLSRAEIPETKKLKEKIQRLTEENSFLTNEVHRLNKMLSKKYNPLKLNETLLKSLKKLEEQVLYEKNTNQQLIFKLRAQNRQFRLQVEELKKSEKFLNMKLMDASRYISQRGCRRPLRQHFSPENSLIQKKGPSSKPLGQTLTNWSSSSLAKPKQSKSLKRMNNRFLSTSTSESEDLRQNFKSRERKIIGTSKEESSFKKSRPCSKKSINDKSDSKKSIRTNSQERSKLINVREDQTRFGVRSRESSLSSRASSKQSKISHLSNRGSGDHLTIKTSHTPRSNIDEREDIKFSMSDLESRIHALQKLLSEGLNF